MCPWLKGCLLVLTYCCQVAIQVDFSYLLLSHSKTCRNFIASQGQRLMGYPGREVCSLCLHVFMQSLGSIKSASFLKKERIILGLWCFVVFREMWHWKFDPVSYFIHLFNLSFMHSFDYSVNLHSFGVYCMS